MESLTICFLFYSSLFICTSDEIYTIWQNELSAILRFGAEELFKEEKTDEETKRKLESMDIDEILERAEKVETKAAEGEEGNELLSAFKACDMHNHKLMQNTETLCTLKFLSIMDKLVIDNILVRLPIFRVVRMTPHFGVD